MFIDLLLSLLGVLVDTILVFTETFNDEEANGSIRVVLGNKLLDNDISIKQRNVQKDLTANFKPEKHRDERGFSF